MTSAAWVVLLLASAVLLVGPQWGLLAWWRRQRERQQRELREDALKHLLKCEAEGATASLLSLAGALRLGDGAAAAIVAELERGGFAGAAFALRARLDATTVPLVNVSVCSSCSMEWINALLFFSAAGDAAARDALPLDLAYPEKMVALFRSSWAEEGAFVGFRAGSNCSWCASTLVTPAAVDSMPFPYPAFF